MKKLRTTLFVCLTALAVLTAFGCKQEAAVAGDDPKAWKHQKDIDMVDGKNVIEIECDKGGEITWGAVFTESNVLIAEVGAPYKGTGTKTPSYRVEVPSAGKYNVYIHQPDAEVEANVSKATSTAGKEGMDFRGLVEVKSGKGKLIKASNAPQRVESVGMVTITNNEVGTWNGNYGVKKVTPAKETSNGKWEAVANFEAIATGSDYLVKQNGGEATILMPAGTYLVAVNQPDRLINTSDKDIAAHIQKNWIDGKRNPMFTYYDSTKDAAGNVENYKKYQAEAYWVAKPVTVEKHKALTGIETKNNTRYLNPNKTITDGGKYVAPLLYEVVEVPAGEK